MCTCSARAARRRASPSVSCGAQPFYLRVHSSALVAIALTSSADQPFPWLLSFMDHAHQMNEPVIRSVVVPRHPTQGSTSQSWRRCTIPYAKDTIPLFIVFRAMGFVADKEILHHIVYDFGDVEMMDLLRPSIEEAVHVTSEDVALDWIARRITAPYMVKAKRIAYARDILQKELLPHIGIGEMTESKKAYFLGYMVHRMLLVALGRQPQTDRDNYCVKRLRMAGPLMADLFRCAPPATAPRRFTMLCDAPLRCGAMPAAPLPNVKCHPFVRHMPEWATLLATTLLGRIDSQCFCSATSARMLVSDTAPKPTSSLMVARAQGTLSENDEGDDELREEAVRGGQRHQLARRGERAHDHAGPALLARDGQLGRAGRRGDQARRCAGAAAVSTFAYAA